MEQLETIYVVFKTHVDIGFTGLAEEVIQSYKTQMIHDVLRVCEDTQVFSKDHQYVWTMPAWLLFKTLEGLPEEKQKRVEKLIEGNQLAWHSLPFTTHTEFCGVEEFIRGMYFSKQLSDRFHKKAISAKMTDVPGHTWMLPSILYKAGVRFLHLGCNSCSTPPDVPRLFFWEGPDGNRVLTYYSKGEYGTDLLPDKDWEYPIWMALQQTHDNFGPQSAEIIENILQEVKLKSPGTKVVVGTMDDFAKDFLERNYADIPVIKKDLADTWIHGIGTYPQEVAAIRRLRPEITTLELLGTMENLLGQQDRETKQSYHQSIRKAYESSLLFGEHTWGLDMKITLLPLRNGVRIYDKENFLKDKNSDAYKRAETSWDEQRGYIAQTVREIEHLHPFERENSKANIDNKIISVFNPLAWVRERETIILNDHKKGYLIDLENGEKHDVFEYNGKNFSQVYNIPALGYKLFQFIPSEDKEKSNNQTIVQPIAVKNELEAVIENEFVCVRVDEETGTIVSLYDKKSQKEWVKREEHLGFGEYTYDVYGKEDILNFVKGYAYDLTDWYVNDFGKAGYPRQKRREYRSTISKIDIENGPGWGRILIEQATDPESYEQYGNSKKVKVSITLGRDQKGIDLKYELLDKQETPFAEAGHFVFPLNTFNPQYRIQKMGSVIDPVTDIQKDANTRIHCIDGWIDVEDEGAGIGIIPIDTPLVSIGEKGVYQFSEFYIPQQSVLFFNGFNNQWGTNFPQWMGGDYTFEYRIVLHSGNWREGNVWKESAETTTPLKVMMEFKPVVHTKNSVYSLIRKDIEGVKILAFKPSEEGNDYILRFQDVLGENRSIDLSFQQTIKEMVECDLLENELNKIQLFDHDTVAINVKPFEIYTLKLKMNRS